MQMSLNIADKLIPCIKCNNSPGDFYQLENTNFAGYCSNCFSQVIRQKFTSCFGRNRIFKNPLHKDVLLIFIPNHLESIYLLHFTYLSVCESSDHRKLRINVKVLLLLDEFTQEKYDWHIIQNFMKEYHHQDWNWYATHISNIFEKPEVISLEDKDMIKENVKTFKDKNFEKFSLLLANCRSISVRNEIIRLITAKFIFKIANHLNCPIILLPESSNQLAENALNSICFGRGSAISNISAVLDTRFLGSSNSFSIKLVRPLHDISIGELKAMQRLNFHKLFSFDNDNEKNFKINDDRDICVQELTGHFIETLRQSGFPSTISTILSVSSKVENQREGIICAFCFERYQQSQSETTSLCSPCKSLIDEMNEEGRIILINEILN